MQRITSAALIATIIDCGSGKTTGGTSAQSAPASLDSNRLSTGARLDPAGRSIPVGNMPLSAVLSPDGKHLVLIEACRGKQVDFAAKGADVQAAAGAPNIYVPVRGTSFASPIIARMFAMDLETPDPAQAKAALAKWKGIANDLGKPGRDDVYGEGELGDFRDSMLGNTRK